MSLTRCGLDRPLFRLALRHRGGVLVLGAGAHRLDAVAAAEEVPLLAEDAPEVVGQRPEDGVDVPLQPLPDDVGEGQVEPRVVQLAPDPQHHVHQLDLALALHPDGGNSVPSGNVSRPYLIVTL